VKYGKYGPISMASIWVFFAWQQGLIFLEKGVENVMKNHRILSLIYFCFSTMTALLLQKPENQILFS